MVKRRCFLILKHYILFYNAVLSYALDLFKEIEHLAKAKLELQCQAEKDCSILNAQIKILEVELEEQLNKNQKISKMSLEIANLKEQIQALERQLKNQRDFMDVRKLKCLGSNLGANYNCLNCQLMLSLILKYLL